MRVYLYLTMLVCSLSATCLGQPINNWVKDVVLENPNVAALHKFSDIPVDLSSGLPNVSLPIHELQYGAISVPIVLSYHAQGVRVADNASWVGLNWSLFAGGEVTRSVRGIPDEEGGYYYNGNTIFPPNPVAGTQEKTSYDNKLCSTLSPGWNAAALSIPTDAEPDMFSYNFNGFSGKFYFDKDRNLRKIDNSDDVEIVPVVTTGGFEAFTILTPTGLRYIFGKYAAKTSYETLLAGGASRAWRTTWKLLRVETYDSKYYVDFTYAAESYQYKTLTSGYWLMGTDVGGSYFPGTNGYDIPKHNYTNHQVSGQRLVSIKSPIETVDFVSTISRLDLDAATNCFRLERIEVKTGGSTYCKRFDLAYSYAQDGTSSYSYHKRLLLQSIQEKSCDNAIVIPPHTFTYRGNYVNGKLFLPNRLSKAIDHWGFYNGKHENESTEVNVPPTTVSLGPGPSLYTYGSANRESVESYMLYGSLQRHTYPTGGYTEFGMEANSATKNQSSNVTLVNNLTYSTGACVMPDNSCCAVLNKSQSVTFSSVSQIQNAKFDIQATTPAHTGLGNCTNGLPAYVTIDILQGSIVKGTYTFNLSAGQTQAVQTNKALSLISNSLSAGVAYTFRMTTGNCKGIFKLYSQSLSPQNYLVGGLRVKTITTSDNYSSTPIVKSYTYNDPSNNLSSGKLITNPEYGTGAVYTEPVNNGQNQMARFHDYSQIANIDFIGRHILYKNVKEDLNGAGSTEYTFNAIGLTNAAFGDLYTGNSIQTVGTPITPVYEPANGKLLSKISKSSSGATVKSETYTYTTSYSYMPGYAMVGMYFTCRGYWTGNSDVGPKSFIANIYSIRSGQALLSNMTVSVDGVSTTTTYTYDQSARHFQPTSTTMSNSDGKSYQTTYKYIYDLTAGTLRDRLLTNNLLLPATEQTVAVAGLIVDGQRINYNWFTTAGAPSTSCTTGCVPYPHTYYNYEMTWTSAGAVPGVWELAGTVNAMNMSAGRPATFTVANWQSETYTWTNGLLAKKKFGDHETIYAYTPGSKLISSVTGIDKQVTSYTYDVLSRLSKTTERGGNVVTNYIYKYKDATNAYNSVTKSVKYTAVTGSALTNITEVEYLDGLGRVIENVKQQYRPTKGSNDQSLTGVDVATYNQYDAQGRLWKTSLPFVGSTTNGSFISVPSTLKYTTTTYYPDPLNRVYQTTTVLGHTSAYVYGKNTSSISIPGTTISYPAGSLIMTKLTDADNRVTLTYTDKLGRSVYSQATNTSSSAPATTYTEYDDKSRVKRVIPPGATASSSELTFRYEYDRADNLISKKIPGAAAVTYRYNNRDLLTLWQDGNRAAGNQSIGTVYDNYGRPTKTGLVTGFPTDGNSSLAFADEYSRTHYDGFDGTTQLDLATNPQYRGRKRREYSKVLGTSTWLYATMAYDAYGRTSQQTGNNYLLTANSTAESTTFSYDWADNLIKQSRTHQPGSAATTGTRLVESRNEYDAKGRHIKAFLKLDGVETQLAEYNYNFRNELIERNLHSGTYGTTTGWLQSVDYTYNDAGWMTRINDNTVTGGVKAFPLGCTPGLPTPGATTLTKFPETNDLFYLELRYEELLSSTNGGVGGITGKAEKGGNISQMVWRARGRERQVYDFRYDHLNRMLSATYYDVPGSTSGTASASNRFNESLTYDLRGNILTLQRNGYYASTCGYGQIDNLTYAYNTTYPNRVNSIADAAPASQASQGFNPDKGGSGYTYDVNGNLKTDSYKGITNITYNHLNLPAKVEWGTTKSVEYTYDAAGGKLRKTVKSGTTITSVQDYLGGMEYRQVGATGSKRVEAIYHAEGRYFNLNVDNSNTLNWRKEYSIADHLGNSRVTFSDKDGDGTIEITGTAATNEVLQEQHYYPFGLSFQGPWLQNDASRDNAYRYNGKELNEEVGLYDYGARWYDPAIGRWTSVDPLADHPSQVMQSPYHYAANNPILHTDPDGKCPPWLCGAVAGAATDYGIQVVGNLLSGEKTLYESFTEVDGNSIKVSALAGAASGGLSMITKLKQAKTLIQFGAEATVDGSGSAINQYVTTGEVSVTEALGDGVVGAFVGRGTGAAGEYVARNTPAGKVRANQLRTEVRRTGNRARNRAEIAANGGRPRPAQAEAAKQAEAAAAAQGASAGVGAGVAGSGVTGSLIDVKTPAERDRNER